MPEIKTVKAGGRDLKILPFNLEQAELADPALRRLADPATRIAAMSEVIAIGLQRGNPDVTLDWVRHEIDFREADALFDAILKVSGLQPAAPGEAPSP